MMIRIEQIHTIYILRLLTENIEYKNNPDSRNYRYPELEYSFSSLVIHRPIHASPYSKNTSTNCNNPEHFLRNSPPMIDRFDLINTHHEIGEYIETEKTLE